MARRIDTQAVINAVRLLIGGKPSAPAAGYDLLYAKSGGIYVENEGGTETGPLMANPMTTAGDLILGGASGAAGRLAIGANTTVLTSNGTTASWAAAPVTVLNDYICIKDVKAQNTPSGTFAQDGWRVRDLNTEQSDTGGHASVAANQITLAAGTYIVSIKAPAFCVKNHQAKLYNVTGAADLIIGSSEYAHYAAGNFMQNSSFITGKIVLAGTTVLEVQHYCSQTFADNGFGWSSNIAAETFTICEFWKVA